MSDGKIGRSSGQEAGSALALSLGVKVFVVFLRAYQVVMSPLFAALGAHCRFEPTCSTYAIEGLKKYGVVRGTWRAFARLARCHPLHPGGFDPP